MYPPLPDPSQPQSRSMDSQFVSTATLSAQQSTRWGCFMTGLWLYSLFVTGLMVAIMIGQIVSPHASRSTSSGATRTDGAIVIIVMFLPVLLFVVLTGIQNFKKR